MAERTSVNLRVRDLARVGLTVATVSASDMAETANGWLYRCFRDGANVIVERSLDAGKLWSAITVGQSRVAVPTLAVDRWDTLWCWFGDLTTAYGYVSPDYGESWSQIAAHLGGGPRMAVAADASYLVMHDGGSSLTVYRTSDGGATISPIYAVPDLPKQLAALELDRRGVLHLLYRDADLRIFHRWSDEPAAGVFSAPTQFGTGQFPVLALGQDQRQPAEGGLLAYFWGALLHLQRLDETGAGLRGSAVVPSGTYAPGYLGILLDRRHQGWLTVKPPGAPHKSLWTGDSLIGWSDP